MNQTTTQAVRLVTVGSKVTVEIYLGRVLKNGLEYEKWPTEQTFVIHEGGPPKGSGPNDVSSESFIGRALMGAHIGSECETDFGVSIKEVRMGQVSGCHIKYKALNIE